MLSELLYSPTAVERSIPNDPTPTELIRMADACKSLYQLVREGIGRMKVTSGFRSLALNSAIGGSKTSAHCRAWALDSQPQEMTLQKAMEWLWAHRAELPLDQAILELGKHHDRTHDDWLHLGYKHPSTYIHRREFLVMENGVYRVWQPPR